MAELTEAEIKEEVRKVAEGVAAMEEARAQIKIVNFLNDVMNGAIIAGTGKKPMEVLSKLLDDIAKIATGLGFTQDQAVMAISMMLLDMGLSQMKMTQSFMQGVFLAVSGLKPSQPGNKFIIVPEGVEVGNTGTANAETPAPVNAGGTTEGR